MARILITAHGTRGDVIPSLRLSRALARRGHDINLALSPNHCQLASDWGFSSVAIGPKFDSDIMNLEFNKWSIKPDDMSRAMTPFVEVILKPYLVSAFHDFASLVPEYDLVISNHVALWAAPACKKHGTLYATLHMTVINIPSLFYLPTGVPTSPSTEASKNERAWKLARLVNRRFLVEPMRQTYEELGLPVPRQLLLEESLSPYLNLLPLDPVWVNPAPDWPKNIVQTGSFHPEPDEMSVIPEEAKSFVEAGRSRPLLVFAFGSMPRKDPQAFYESFISVARGHGLRLMILEGWGGSTGISEADVLSLPSVPHEWLFQHASIVVHHGGTGTSAECVRQGVPQIVVPHGFFDQPDNAMRVQRLGCGTWMNLKDFTPAKFDELLSDFLTRLPLIRQQAEVIRGQLQPDGKENCAKAVEQFLHNLQS